MDTITVAFQLPLDLAQKAEQAGLLTEDAFTQWLQQSLERRSQIADFFASIDRLAALEPGITPQEIDAEIQAYRDELP